MFAPSAALVPASTSPVARRGRLARLDGPTWPFWTAAWEDDMQRMRVLSQLVHSMTAGPCDQLELNLLSGPNEEDVDATPEGYPTEWEAECLRIVGDAGLSVGDNFLPPPNSRWRSPDGRSFDRPTGRPRPAVPIPPVAATCAVAVRITH